MRLRGNHSTWHSLEDSGIIYLLNLPQTTISVLKVSRRVRFLETKNCRNANNVAKGLGVGGGV